MAEIALSVVSLLRESLMTMLSEEAHLLGGVRAEVQGMESELRGMLTLLTTGEASRDKEWVDEVRELAYDTQDSIDIYRLRIAAESKEDGSIGFLDKALHFLKTLPRRRQIAKEIQAIKAKLERLHNIRSRYETQPGLSTGQDSLQRRNDARLAAPCVDEDQLVAMEGRKDKLMELLLGEQCELAVISVVGMGGLGKTTVAWKLFEDERVKEIFPYSAWIGVSQQSDPRVHLVHLITQLFDQGHQVLPQGLSFMTELELNCKLKQFLLNKRYMIILDDVRDDRVWERIACAFPNSKNGSRVMVTTQLQNISYAIGSCGYHNEKYPLPCLREDEAWRLFCRRAFRADAGFGCPQHLYDVAKRIVGRCAGLPLAIVTLGGLLANKPRTPNEWDRLHDSLIPELQSNKRSTSVERILSLGYDDLPAHLKTCFLCFGVSPVIKQTRLMRIWMAEGFVGRIEGRTQEEVAMDYLKELADRSLVQVSDLGPLGRAKFCRVHGFMHEILKSKCKDQNFCYLLHEPPANGNNNLHGPASRAPPSRKIRRLSVRGSSSQAHQSMASLLRRTKLQRTNCGARLRSLIIAIRAPTPILGTFPDLSYKLVMLRVLDLEGTNVSGLSDQIASCRLLKYLSLRNTNLDSLPESLGKLLNLETLDLRGTRMRSLPAEVINLHRLRHLLVSCPTSCSPTSIDATHAAWYELAARPSVRVPPGVGQLRDLVKLALFDIGHGDGVVGELRNLTQLRKLGVRCIRREDGEQLCAAIEKMSYLRSLVLHSVGTAEPLDLQSLSSPPGHLEHLFLAGPLGKLPTWAQSLHSVVKIVLMGSRLEEDLFDAFQRLPNLTLLSLIEAFAGRHLCSSSGGFKQLKMLHLSMLNGLESVTVAKGAMPALRKLSIWYCWALEQVPSGIEHLSSLEELHLLGMHEEFVGKLRNNGTDRGKVERIKIIRSSTLMKSQGDDWSQWMDDDLKCNIAAEMEEEEDEENDDGHI